MGAGFTRFLVRVAGLRLGLLMVIFPTPLNRLFIYQGWDRAKKVIYAINAPISLCLGFGKENREINSVRFDL
jgi:hypothetical protein